MNKILKIAFLLLLFLSAHKSGAQDKNSHEIGIISGSASFTTDYGQRNNFMSNVGGNVGIGIGLIYYLNFQDGF